MDGRQFEADVISDEDYEQALRRQEIVLLAEGEARRVLGQLRVRIERGAVEQSAKYYFDARLGIVRSKRGASAVKRMGPGRAGANETKAEGTGT